MLSYFTEMVYLVSGELHAEVEGKQFILKPGDLAIFHPRQIHSFSDFKQENEEALYFYVIKFDDMILSNTTPGSPKLPKLLQKYTGKSLDFKWTSGTEFEEDLSGYKLIIHCGGCMLNEREMKYRLKCAVDQNTPMTNYGTAIAYMNGILKRSLSVFTDISRILDN